MPVFNGTLNSNEIFAGLFNMIISQRVYADNIKGTYSTLVDRSRADGTLYGDTKLFYATDALKSHDWLNDAEAQNLLAIDRPPEPKCQSLVINVFRQIRITVDYYLSKRAWSTEGAFSEFNSVMLGWIRDTKRVYDSTIVNSYYGTAESSIGEQQKTVTFPNAAAVPDLEARSRISAQRVMELLGNLMIDLKDVSRDFNDYAFLRSYLEEDLLIIWNSEAKNKILNIDLPTIFNNEDLKDKLEREILPARYFGTPNTEGGTAPEINTTIRSLIETDYAVESQEDDPRAKQENNQWIVHVFPGDLLPGGSTYLANETYTQDNTILFKVYHKDSIKYMSAFEVGTSFFNPRSLTENHYLTFGHNTLEYLKNYPVITVRYAEEATTEEEAAG